jgi:hypothetical protein
MKTEYAKHFDYMNTAHQNGEISESVWTAFCASLIKELIFILRADENYTHRGYDTIGGMWTIDTWKKNGVSFQLMDEGATSRVFSLDFDVVLNYYDVPTFHRGCIADVIRAQKSLDAASPT